MTDAQLQSLIAIGTPILVNIVFNGVLIGIMWQHLSSDILEIRSDLKIITGKIYDLDNRVSRIEDKLKI
jgi:hypothetical protein